MDQRDTVTVETSRTIGASVSDAAHHPVHDGIVNGASAKTDNPTDSAHASAPAPLRGSARPSIVDDDVPGSRQDRSSVPDPCGRR
jgi:hypothetical protein